MTCATFVEFLLSGIGSFFTALFGAGFGAYAAYFLAVKQQRDNERATQYRAGTAAMFTVIARFSALENFCRNYLNGGNGPLLPEIESSHIGHYTPDTKIDFSSLSFLADPADSELLNDLHLSESHFFNFVEALRERNDYLEKFLGASTIENFNPNTGESVVRSNLIEFNRFSDHNRSLVSGAVHARDSTHLQFMNLAKMLKRRFVGLPVFSTTILEK